MIDTGMLHDLQATWARDGSGGVPSPAKVPLGRIAQPEEIVRAALFLASDDAEYITGQTLNVCGGIVMS
jgi:3-oxoacyl-[acyl-carrier protein] reductase